MNGGDGLFRKMWKEAMDDLASGEKGTWREIETNTLFLACFGMLYNELMHKLAHPLRWLAGSAAVAVITYIISVAISALGGG